MYYNNRFNSLISKLKEYRSKYEAEGMKDFSKVYGMASVRLVNNYYEVSKLDLNPDFEIKVFRIILEEYIHYNHEDKYIASHEYYKFKNDLEDIFNSLKI